MNVFFKFRDMSYYQTPQKFGLHIIIGVYDSVARVDYGSCIWNFHRWIRFSYPIYGLSHNFGFTFHDTFTHYIFLK